MVTGAVLSTSKCRRGRVADFDMLDFRDLYVLGAELITDIIEGSLDGSRETKVASLGGDKRFICRT